MKQIWNDIKERWPLAVWCIVWPCNRIGNIMAKKTAKSTREQVYREILDRAGIRFEDCDVLAFAFKQERRPELFHFGLMLHEPRPVLQDPTKNVLQECGRIGKYDCKPNWRFVFPGTNMVR